MTHGRLDFPVCFQSGEILLVFFSDPQDIALTQIRNILAPGAADPSDNWHSCKLDLAKCSPDQLSIVQGEQFACLNNLCIIKNVTHKRISLCSNQSLKAV